MSQSDLHANQAMALSQLYTNEIHQPELLEAIASTPRDMFVPKHLADVAYVDEELPLGEGRYILAPLDTARLFSAANIQPSERVLDIGGGMGYTSIIAAKLAREVVAIETSAMFIKQLEEARAALSAHNIRPHVVESLRDGFAASQPYDVILIHGAVEELPAHLMTQLAEDGRIVYIQVSSQPRPGANGLGVLTIIKKQGFNTSVSHGVECFAPALEAFKKTAIFTFG